jgi:hypothetical protein
MKFDTWVFFKRSVEKIQFSSISGKNNKYCTSRPMYIYDNTVPNPSDNEKCFKQNHGEYQHTHFMLNNFSSYCSPLPKKKILRLWDNVERYCRVRQATDGNTIWHMHFAYWILKATDTHSECVILLAFAHQQWLCKCTSVLHLHVHCLSCSASFMNHVWNEWIQLFI